MMLNQHLHIGFFLMLLNGQFSFFRKRMSSVKTYIILGGQSIGTNNNDNMFSCSNTFND